MSYTIKKLAKISGISVRTLHWYDEIGLLKPAYLFFRELDFKLDNIHKILASNDFDKIKALCVHKQTLEENLNRQKKLLITIDKTISHLTGRQKMQDEDLYTGFEIEKPKGYQQFLVKYSGAIAEDLIGMSKKNDKLDQDALKNIEDEANFVYKQLAKSIDCNLTPRAKEVQILIQKHFQLIGQIHEANLDVYLAYAQLYCEKPEFIQFFNSLNIKLSEFIAKAMRVYAKNNLS